jgi:hypothetical protein
MRLFWISIIIVELVFAYIVWRPYRDRVKKSSHRAAVIPRPVPQPEIKAPETKPFPVIVATAKPPAGVRPHATQHKLSPVVNASLKSPEPIPSRPTPAPKVVSGPVENFWCHLSSVETTCDCKLKNDEHTANLVVP